MNLLRMEKRKKVLTFTPVYDFYAKVLLGYLGDLTLKGALLISEEPVEVNRVLTLAIEFREKSEIPAEQRITIPARVTWSGHEPHRTYYNNGLLFLEMTQQNKALIEGILEKYQFHRDRPLPVG